MGQRLVINATRDGETIASLYYHWGAYTTSSVYYLRLFAEHLVTTVADGERQNLSKMSTEDLQLAIIRYAEMSEGCIDGGKGSNEWNYITEKFPNETFKEDGNRNNGLVAISKDGIANFGMWGEGFAYIDVDSLEGGTDVYWIHEPSEDDDDTEQKEYVDIPNFPYLEDVDYTELQSIEDKLSEAEDKGFCFTRDGLTFDIIA